MPSPFLRRKRMLNKHQQHLEELKKQLQISQDFSDIGSYFMDHFGEDPDFMSLSKKTNHPLLLDLMRMTAKEKFGCHVNKKRCIFLTHECNLNFFHGVCNTGTGLIVVFFFKDIDMGMMIHTDFSRNDHLTNYARFSIYSGKGVNDLAGKTLMPSDQSVRH
jgi:hypothetical protein